MTQPKQDAGGGDETHAAAKARLPQTVTRSVTHATFRVERTYDASLRRVWQALTDPAEKARWFGGAQDQCDVIERSLDVRPGGRERLEARWDGGVTSTFDAVYFDVVDAVRLVYGYEMHLDERKISVSLATVQLTAQDRQTLLSVTEQGAFLDGYDDAGAREHGTGELLDALGRSLTA